MSILHSIIPTGMKFRTGTSSSLSTLRSVGGCSESTINDLAIQPDGKILISGLFTAWSGTSASYFVRLTSDGYYDTEFNDVCANSSSGQVNTIKLQSDGKILLGGAFTLWDDVSVGRVVRLNTDGTLDTDFATAIGTGANSTVLGIETQPDGKILIVGSFSSWNGTSVGRIVRLNSDGTLDTAFTTANAGGSSGTLYATRVQTDNKILVAGNMTAWGSYGGTIGGLVRLNSDGSIDSSFATATGSGASTNINPVLEIQTDGKILLGGSNFVSWNGTTVGGVVRLNSDGSTDTAFTTQNGTGAASNTSVTGMAIQSDGKILLGGSFTLWNGATVGRVVRLNSNGAIDTAFTTENGTGATGTVGVIAVNPNGQILLAGSFSFWNGETVNRFVGLSSSGSSSGQFPLNAPDVIFAILAGGGGGGDTGATTRASGGGGAGAVVYGLVPTVKAVTIGRGGGETGGNGGISRYSTLYAAGGTGGNDTTTGTASLLGAGRGGSGADSTPGAATTGSTLFTTVGGGGGAGGYGVSQNVIGGNGESGTAGGGGGGAYAPTATFTATGGNGGNGLAGGGGGAAVLGSTNVNISVGGSGGSGLGGPGTAGTTMLSSQRFVGGSGGSGIVGVGAAGSTSSQVAGEAGDGGLGGGGGGGGTDGEKGGTGGDGALLLYW